MFLVIIRILSGIIDNYLVSGEREVQSLMKLATRLTDELSGWHQTTDCWQKLSDRDNAFAWAKLVLAAGPVKMGFSANVSDQRRVKMPSCVGGLDWGPFPV